jgi:hypothetical protein
MASAANHANDFELSLYFLLASGDCGIKFSFEVIWGLVESHQPRA